MELHEIIVDQIEFNFYLMRFKSEILMEPDELLREGDIVLLKEKPKYKNQKSEKVLKYRIKDINRTVGRIEGNVIWNVLLKPLNNYKERLKREMKEFEKSLNEDEKVMKLGN